MRQEKLHKIVSQHGNKIKGGGIVLAIIVMLLAVKTYINYSSITEEIGKVNQDIASVQQEIAYSEKFYSKYLDSDYSMYFLSHKNNILFDGEYIIKISDNQHEDNTDKIDVKNSDIKTPQESRKEFFQSKIN